VLFQDVFHLVGYGNEPDFFIDSLVGAKRVKHHAFCLLFFRVLYDPHENGLGDPFAAPLLHRVYVHHVGLDSIDVFIYGGVLDEMYAGHPHDLSGVFGDPDPEFTGLNFIDEIAAGCVLELGGTVFVFDLSELMEKFHPQLDDGVDIPQIRVTQREHRILP